VTVVAEPLAAPLRVGLLGYGVVGSAVDRVLRERGADVARAAGAPLRVVRALVRDPCKARDYLPDPDILTTDFESILDDPSIDFAVEVMGGIDPADRYVRELLRAGKPVVTANKRLLAARAASIAATARSARLPVRFEAAVCGGVPVVHTLCEAVLPGTITSIKGVLNGTTNYILSRLECGLDYDAALAEAQERGFAEADPTEDVDGADAAAKLCLLAGIAFGEPVEELEIGGVAGITRADTEKARRRGAKLRLLACARRDRHGVRASVGLRALPAEDPLAQLEGVANGVVLEGYGINRITLSGPGAGGLATASAVVADLLALTRPNAASHVARLPHGERRGAVGAGVAS